MNHPNLSPNQKIQPVDFGHARDRELVLAAQAGSPGAFAELYAVYSRRLYRTIIAITRSPEDAEDALQDTFLRAYLSIGGFEGRSGVYTWLSQIAINSALMILRRRRVRHEIQFDPRPEPSVDDFTLEFPDPAPNPEEMCDMRQRRLALRRAIQRLNPRLRDPIRMRIAKGASIKKIGQALNISTTAAKTRLHRARLHIFAACRKS
jgi:RNA polymerase sigma-70 factor, ECF subfamily